MINPYTISLEQVKTFLSINDTSKDTDINKYLPIVTNDMVRVNGICNQSFLVEGTADTTATSNTLTNVNLSTTSWNNLEYNATVLISGEDFVITDSDSDAKTITLNSAVTATATGEDLEIRNVPYGAKPFIAQLVAFQYNNALASSTKGEEVASKSIGSVSVQFTSSDALIKSIDAKFGYPRNLLQALASIRRPRFF